MNLGQLIARCRTEAFDKVAPYLFSDEDWAMWLNEAEEEAVIRKQLLRVNDLTIDITAGERSYDTDMNLYEIVYASLVYAGSTMLPWQIGITTAAEMDKIAPMWRSIPFRPTGIIHYDRTVETNCPPDTAYTLNIEGYRLPSKQMASDSDSPEINDVHHRHLVKWALHRAYSIPDVEILDKDKSSRALAEFDDYFGHRPDADGRKSQNANQPQHNACY